MVGSRKSFGSDKKGLIQETLIGAIIVVVFIILLKPVTETLASAASAEEIVETCRLSVRGASWNWQLNLLVLDFTIVDSPFGLDCRTLFTEITKNSIVRAGDKERFSDDKEEMKGQLKGTIMKDMKDCWLMFGSGKVKVQQALDSDGTACVVCAEIMPSKEFISKHKDEPVELSGMYRYAKEATIPPEDKENYFDYFLKDSIRPAVGVEELDSGSSIVLDKQYSVVFAVAAHSEGSLKSDAKEWFGKGTSIKTGYGIAGCYVGDYGKVTDKSDARDLGCDENGNNPGMIFGKVLDGGFHLAVTSAYDRTYPLTVRLIPTKSLPDYCRRIY